MGFRTEERIFDLALVINGMRKCLFNRIPNKFKALYYEKHTVKPLCETKPMQLGSIEA